METERIGEENIGFISKSQPKLKLLATSSISGGLPENHAKHAL